MEDFIEGLGITQNKLAVAIGVPPRHTNEIVHGQYVVTADTALRPDKCFGVSVQFRLNLQTQYDLDVAEDRLSVQIDAIIPLRVARGSTRHVGWSAGQDVWQHRWHEQGDRG